MLSWLPEIVELSVGGFTLFLQAVMILQFLGVLGIMCKNAQQ